MMLPRLLGLKNADNVDVAYQEAQGSDHENVSDEMPSVPARATK